MIHETIEDFRKRYKGTFLFLTLKDKEFLVRYEEDDGDRFVFYSEAHGNILVSEETARTNLTHHFPETGLYNIEQEANLFTRYPARQWKRAPCADNTYIQRLTNHYINKRFDFEIATSIFYPKYPDTTSEALENLKKSSIAINSKFGLTKGYGKHKKAIILFYKTTPVGLVDNNQNIIQVKYKPLLQEVKDYYNNKEPTWTIKE